MRKIQRFGFTGLSLYGSEFPTSQSFPSQIMGDLYEKCMIINYSKMVEMGRGVSKYSRIPNLVKIQITCYGGNGHLLGPAGVPQKITSLLLSI